MSFSSDFVAVTPRVLVRRVREDDLPALLAVNGDAEVTRFLPYAPWQSMADAEAWLKRMLGYETQGDCWQFVLEHREGGRAIGTCLVFRHDAALHRAELGYVLGRAYWGRGLMQEALRGFLPVVFARLGLERMNAELEAPNFASARLLERLGFIRERTLADHLQRDGRPIESAVYSLARSNVVTA